MMAISSKVSHAVVKGNIFLSAGVGVAKCKGAKSSFL